MIIERDWPETYGTPKPTGQPNWSAVNLWEQENPFPENREDFEDWNEQESLMHHRVWVAWCFPQFRVFDWDDDDVKAAYRLCLRHVCGVCGRADDAGCTLGC